MSRMTTIVTFLATALVAACGDDPRPMTWGDAWRVWGEASCGYAERCVPDRYDPADHADCVTAAAYDGCRDLGCEDDDPFPEGRRADLDACEDGMASLPCGTPYAPDACPRALVP